MNPYRHTISLRIRHPRMAQEQISKALALPPKFAWTVGEPRKTPKGHPLDGVRAESYWSCPLSETKASEVQSLEQALGSTLRSLEPHAEFLGEVAQSGGSAELFIGLFGDRNLGLELPPATLASCGRLGLALSLDIYP
jgi:hypothetical protein